MRAGWGESFRSYHPTPTAFTRYAHFGGRPSPSRGGCTEFAASSQSHMTIRHSRINPLCQPPLALLRLEAGRGDRLGDTLLFVLDRARKIFGAAARRLGADLVHRGDDFRLLHDHGDFGGDLLHDLPRCPNAREQALVHREIVARDGLRDRGQIRRQLGALSAVRRDQRRPFGLDPGRERGVGREHEIDVAAEQRRHRVRPSP